VLDDGCSMEPYRFSLPGTTSAPTSRRTCLPATVVSHQSAYGSKLATTPYHVLEHLHVINASISDPIRRVYIGPPILDMPTPLFLKAPRQEDFK
jgi:hypothetical protein